MGRAALPGFFGGPIRLWPPAKRREIPEHLRPPRRDRAPPSGCRARGISGTGGHMGGARRRVLNGLWLPGAGFQDHRFFHPANSLYGPNLGFRTPRDD